MAKKKTIKYLAYRTSNQMPPIVLFCIRHVNKIWT